MNTIFTMKNLIEEWMNEFNFQESNQFDKKIIIYFLIKTEDIIEE